MAEQTQDPLSESTTSCPTQVGGARARIDALPSRAVHPAAAGGSLLEEVVEELYTTLEELRVSEEELRVQNESLAEAQRAVAAEHQRYQELFDLAPDAYVVTDSLGTILEANRAAAELLNVPQHTLPGKPLAVYFPDAERRAFRAELPRLAGRARAAEWEALLQPRGGHSPIPVAITATAGAAGTGFRWLIRDVIERARTREQAIRLAKERAAREQAEAARQEIRASEERYRLLADHATDVVVRATPQHVVTYVSPSCHPVLGYAPEELVGRSVLDFTHPDDRERVLALREMEGDGLRTLETRVRCPAGGYRWTESTIRALRDPATGEVREIVAATRDISERKRTEIAQRFLAESGAALGSSLDYGSTLRAVARHAVPALADWCVVDVLEGDAIRRLAVSHADPAKVELALALSRMYPLDREAPNRIGRVLRTGEAEWIPDVNEAALGVLGEDPDQLEIVRRIGLRSYIVVPMLARGRVLGAISLAVDDSERRYGAADLALAEELARRAAAAIDNARLYDEAQAAVRARDEVLAVVSHDLRNPLNAITLSSALLTHPSTSDGLSEREMRQLSAIARSAEQMTRLIDDLVDVAGIEAGRLSVDRQPVQVDAMLLESAEMFAPVAADHGVQLRTDVAEDLPLVLADRARVLQVLSNLLGNAVRYAPRGGTVTLGAGRGAGEVCVRVSDTGPGIAPEHREHVFDRFWRVSAQRRAGAGLGLAIARGIVEAHGGRIWAEGEPGEGTTLQFTLPVSGS